jgi:hypothetical protein
MTTICRLAAALSAGAIAVALSSFAFGQADNSNSLIAPAPDSYVSLQPYVGDGRHPDAFAGNRRGLTPYEAERAYGVPYATDGREAWIDAESPSHLHFGGPGIAVGRDSNPDDYATGIYNPKQ